MFGMLILVFIFFFGMPSQGGLSQASSVFSQTGAHIDNEEVTLREALLYARRRMNRTSNELQILKQRFEELEDEVLLDVSARLMGWQSTFEEDRKYIASLKNLDLIFFGEDGRRVDDIFQAFIAQLPDGVTVENMSSEELVSRYVAFAQKGRGFVVQNFKDAVSSWGVSTDEYIAAKGREMRVRSYLNFLQSQVKVSQAQVDAQLERENTRWVFEYALVGAKNVPADQVQVDEAKVTAFLTENETRAKSYYQAHIEDYSKSKVKFTRVTARYSNAEQQSVIEAKVKEAHERVTKGEDPSEVAKSLSGDGIFVSAFVQGDKTRKNTSEELFTQALAMAPGQISEVRHSPTGSMIQIGGVPAQQTGSYSFIRLEEKEEGEEKTFDSVKQDIARLVMAEDRRKESAKGAAEGLLAKARAGEALTAAIDAYNGTVSGVEGVDLIALAESGEVTLDGLLGQNIEGVGRAASAAQALLSEIARLDDSHKVPSVVFEVNGQWAAMVLKQRSGLSPLEEANARKRQTLVAQNAAVGEYFGGRWVSFVMFGPFSFDILRQFPQQVYTALSAELSAALSGSSDGLVDRLLKTNQYRQLVEENPAVIEFLNGSSGS
jgi:hypothetical protein